MRGTATRYHVYNEPLETAVISRPVVEVEGSTRLLLRGLEDVPVARSRSHAYRLSG